MKGKIVRNDYENGYENKLQGLHAFKPCMWVPSSARKSHSTQLSTAAGMDVAAHMAGLCLEEVGHDLQHAW